MRSVLNFEVATRVVLDGDGRKLSDTSSFGIQERSDESTGGEIYGVVDELQNQLEKKLCERRELQEELVRHRERSGAPSESISLSRQSSAGQRVATAVGSMMAVGAVILVRALLVVVSVGTKGLCGMHGHGCT